MSTESSGKSKPRWLIFGGLGFIGRNVVKYLIDNNLASYIRIADKKAPFMSFLSPDYKLVILENPIVECIQIDVADDDMVSQAFFSPPGTAPGASGLGAKMGNSNTTTDSSSSSSSAAPAWDYVINLAAETTLGKKEEFYQKTVDGAIKTATIAASVPGLKKYVFVSSAFIYKSDKHSSKEDGKIAPWTAVAESMYNAETALQQIVAGANLPLVILRPALVYGPGDFNSLMPRCVVAATYKKTGEKMELLWDNDMKINTVHVFDVARAIVFAARKIATGSIFNLADTNDTDVGKITSNLGVLFSISTGFMGSIKSNIANLKLDVVVDAANENHLGPWLSLLKEHNIKNTPLSPYLHKSLLSYNHLAIDGTAIVTTTGFQYMINTGPTIDIMKDAITQHITQGIFPPVL